MSADRLRQLNERIAELFRDDWPISTRAEPPPGTSVDPRDFHNGDFKAQVAPQNVTIAFADDGSNYGEGCQVRMQRIGPWLAVVDNSGCGGAGVSFTGLYRRTNQADR